MGCNRDSVCVVTVLTKDDALRVVDRPQTVGMLMRHGWQVKQIDELERYLWEMWYKAKRTQEKVGWSV